MTIPLPFINLCVGGLVLVLYVCLLLSLYHSTLDAIYCRDECQITKEPFDTDEENLKGQSVSASSSKRPRMIQTLEETEDVDDKNVTLHDDDFSKAAQWMQMDVNYLTKHVIPKHDELMTSTKLFGDGKHKVTANDKCPVIKSTMQLMNKDNAAIYTCVEKGLLNVLPQMNQPVTQDAAPKPAN